MIQPTGRHAPTTPLASSRQAATEATPCVMIGDRRISCNDDVFVIAEIGINHNGSIAMALELIEAAAKAGADAVKFQKRDVPVVFSKAERETPREFDRSFIEHALGRSVIEDVVYPVFPESGQRERLERWVAGTDVPTYNGDLKYALEFGPKEWDMIRARCEELGMMWGVSCWDGLSVFEIDGFQPSFHKIASACLTHADLLERVRRCNRPVILSTGGSTLEQVRRAVEILGREQLVILHCVATYPSCDDEANLAVIDTLREEFPDVPIGYSGHEEDLLASTLAVSRGACLVERHITLNRSLPGSDQKASIEPAMFRELVDEMRRVVEFDRPQPEAWASEADLRRVPTLLGTSEKRVLAREVPVMHKLRRVNSI